jgi:hypothetical protein
MKIKFLAASVLKVKFLPFIFLSLLTWLFTVQPVLAAEESSDEWKFGGAFYIWMPDIDIETASEEDIEISFNDIIKNLDLTLMGNIRGHKGKWGFLIDAVYLDISDDLDNSLGRLGLLTLTKIELTTAIVSPVVTYRVIESGRLNLDLLGGIRYFYLDVTVKVDPLPDAEDDGSATSGIVGVSGDVQLSKNWYMPFYYDVGKGDTDLTYQVWAAFNYRYSSFDLSLGYRYLKIKFDEDDEFGELLNHIIVKGPMIGARFTF